MSRNAWVMMILLIANAANAASFFNSRLSVQGYLKSGGSALNDATGYPMKFIIKKNGTAVWCQTSASNVPVSNGIFNQVLSGNSNCSSLTNALDETVLAHTANSDAFTIDVTVDVSKDGFGGADDASFAGIDLLPSPFAIAALHANTAETLSGVVDLAHGGTGATDAASARTALGLSSLATLAPSGNSAHVLKGDGTFGAPAGVTLAGDVSGASGTTTVDKIKGRSVSASAPTAGQVLTWNNGSSTWEPQSPGVTSVAGKYGAVTISSSDVTDASASNSASTLVKRDASGNFSAGTITATLSGTATNVSGTVAVANGGTGGTDAATARTNLGAAASGVNTDITSINGSARQASIVMAPATAGTTTAYTLTNSPALSALATGQTIFFRMNATNTGAATLNVDGLGAKNLFSHSTGAAVAAGDLQINKVMTATYDGTQWLVVIPPQYYTASSLSCGASITANSFVTCTNIAASTVNAGDRVNCSPSADPGAGQVTWSTLATAGNISIRLGCNSTSACTLTARNWKCVVDK